MLALPASGDTYYVSNDATIGEPCTYAEPCKPSLVWNASGDRLAVAPGDTVIYKDGTYTGADYMLNPPDSLLGTAVYYITVQAETDGGVTLNGEGDNAPIWLNYNSFMNIEGFNAHSSSSHVVYVSAYNNTRYINLKRIVAWDAYDNNSMVFSLGGNNVLGEDLAGFGIGRKTYGVWEANNLTCRRCWGRWEGSTQLGPKMAATMFYNSNEVLYENSIFSWTTAMMPETYTLQNDGVISETGQDECTIQNGWGPVADDALKPDGGNYPGYQNSADSTFIGGFVYSNVNPVCGNANLGSFYFYEYDYSYSGKHCSLTIGTSCTVDGDCPPSETCEQNYVEPANDVKIENVAAFMHSSSSFPAFHIYWDDDQAPSISPSNLNLKDATSVGPVADNIDGQWSQTDVEHETEIDSLADSVYTGDGAHICYRYEDGSLIEPNEPLFPWPMQDRILDATTEANDAGHSHILLQDCDATCGESVVTAPHAIANVHAEIEAMFGYIPSACWEGGAPPCGDSAVSQGEECDDGNTSDGDGCSSTCQLEGTSRTRGWTGSTQGLSSVR